MYFQVWQSEKNGEWYWRAQALNHEPIAQSEGYKQQASALHAVNLIRAGAAAATIYNAAGVPIG